MYRTARRIRKWHRYLGLIIGIQFLFWTVSGLYFSWTNIDEIHGDPFLRTPPVTTSFTALYPIDSIHLPIQELELIGVGKTPYYWINDSLLVNANNGMVQKEITLEQVREVVQHYVDPNLRIQQITRIESTDAHHEYRGRPLPAYAVQFDHPEGVTAYIAAESGKFQRIRHRSWRWFDFLWMTHTMDYQGRDDFNNLLLRIFSFFGVVTVCSGFLLWGVSSPTLRKWRTKH